MTENPDALDSSAPESITLDIHQIMAILPHRYPFLLIDRVIELERRTRLVAIKNVTINEPHFNGHFPGLPVMPAVLMVESIAQAGGALLLTEIEDREKRLMLLTGIDNARFRRQVTPGDQLRVEVKVMNWRRGTSDFVRMAGAITVDGKLACEATVSCALVQRVEEDRQEPQAAARAAAPQPAGGILVGAGESAE